MSFDPESIVPIARALRDSMDNPAALRQACSDAQAQLEQAFDAQADILDIVRSRALFVDEILRNAWLSFVHGSDDSPELALVAVGGYGRGELHPRSDVDILILVDRQTDSLGDLLGRFLTFLWDVGLEIGHSVRTPEECGSEAADDLTIATNMMESRLLIGSEGLYTQMRQATGPDRVWPAREFFKAKLKEQENRHARFDDSAYKVEPNVKESPGGLRDLQTIGWTLSRGFGLHDLKELVDIGFLKKEECAELMDGKAFLWRVRFALHAVAGRREDRLLFDHQVALARRFNYSDADNNLAVEQFMQKYYRTVQELSRLGEMLLQLLQEEVLFNDANQQPVPLDNGRYRALHGYLEFTDKTILSRFPFALLEIFLVFGQHPDELKGIRARTIRLMRANLWRIDDGFRNDIRARSLFLELLRQPQGITHSLRAMHRYGVLDAYLPAFGQIAGLMQYDLYHTYTVDEHTLMVLRNARRLFIEDYAKEVPTAHRVAKLIHKPHLLYVACLFHDIAKGRGGDHSELGAEEATQFCEAHQFGRYDTHLVVWLVRSHLLMSMTTQRMDISDPEVVKLFAAQVGDETHLNYIYLLTVADIRGTNAELWTDWKAALLRELYHSARNVLRRGIAESDTTDQYIADRKADALTLLSHVDLTRVEQLWNQFTNDYFLRHTFQEIAWHSDVIVTQQSRDQDATKPIVAISNEATRAGTAIFVYSRDSKGLFAICTAVLAQHGLDVLDARILTTGNGHTLDTFIVFDEAKTPLRNKTRLDNLQAALEKALADPNSVRMSVNRHVPRQVKHFNMAPVIGFDSDINTGVSIMELIAPDRPGLLSAVGRAFAACDVSLVNARVTTLGERAEDVFFITDTDGQMINDEHRLACIRSAVTEALSD